MYIGEFAKRAGATPKAIRLYENIGLLPQASRRGKYRTYDTRYIETVNQIKQAQQLGFSLRELVSICQGKNIERGLPAEVILNALMEKKAKLNQEIARLEQKREQFDFLMAELNCSTCELDSVL